MKQNGVPQESRIYGHSRGYDLIERPLLRSDETMTLEKGMNLSYTRPMRRDRCTRICDNYLVGENGASDCLHRTPKKIFEL